MARKKKGWRHAPPAFRHRVPVPVPRVAEIEQPLEALLSPSLLAPRRLERPDPRQPQRPIRLRARLLTLPVLVAIIVSLVWRRLGAVAEVRRVLAREGVLWVKPLEVSEQAIRQRLDTLPAPVMAELFGEVWARLRAQPTPSWPGLEEGESVRAHFPLSALADGSTLEALRKKTPALQAVDGLALAGRGMMIGEAFSHRPVWQLYTEDAAAKDKRFPHEILAAVSPGGLLVFDLGVFSFLWCDAFTEAAKDFVTRMRQGTSYRTLQVLSQGPAYRAELVQVGTYRSQPCRQRLRLGWMQLLSGSCRAVSPCQNRRKRRLPE